MRHIGIVGACLLSAFVGGCAGARSVAVHAPSKTIAHVSVALDEATSQALLDGIDDEMVGTTTLTSADLPSTPDALSTPPATEACDVDGIPSTRE